MNDRIMIHNLGGMPEEELKAILYTHGELNPRFYRVQHLQAEGSWRVVFDKNGGKRIWLASGLAEKIS